MSESERQGTESPLLSERGVTKISDTVVSSIAGMAAQEVEGVHMGGGTSRAASGVLGSITGSESKTSGISVEVGATETAIDLKMGVEYNKNILQTVEEVRRRITDRVEEMTGLRIKELNATITDITFPEKEQRRRLGPASSTRESDSEQATDTAPVTQPEPETQQPETQQPETQQPETQQAEATPVEPTSPTDIEGSSVPEEEVRVEDRPLEEKETTELRTEEQQTDEAPETSEVTQETSAETETTQETSAEAETTQEVRAETETPEEAEMPQEPETAETESPEARMRRRAEERARRRRRRNTEDS